MTRANMTSTTQLIEMLTVRRPAGSKSERKFIRKYIEPLGVQRDSAGNLWKRIGDAPVMWSCHTDTVHRAGGRQAVVIENDIVGLPLTSASNCLGADDTAGIWLMSEMIRAERPGLYIFHRAEECGGIGSDHIAKTAKVSRLLDGIECAIALDRRGTGDVITHQGNRTCSDTFATALAAKLGGLFRPDDSGIFTDTANYTDLIGECTNLSVGYDHQHTARETLNLRFIAELRDKLCSLDTRDLPIERKPGDTDPDDYWFNRYGKDDWNGKGDWYGSAYHSSHYEQRPMSELVADHPKAVADILQCYGISASDLIQELKDRGELL